MIKYLEKIRKLFFGAPVEGDQDLSGESLEEVEEAGVNPEYAEISHPEAGALQSVKSALKGHGEQTVLPDECQYGDNDLCYVES